MSYVKYYKSLQGNDYFQNVHDLSAMLELSSIRKERDLHEQSLYLGLDNKYQGKMII